MGRRRLQETRLSSVQNKDKRRQDQLPRLPQEELRLPDLVCHVLWEAGQGDRRQVQGDGNKEGRGGKEESEEMDLCWRDKQECL